MSEDAKMAIWLVGALLVGIAMFGYGIHRGEADRRDCRLKCMDTGVPVGGCIQLCQ